MAKPVQHSKEKMFAKPTLYVKPKAAKAAQKGDRTKVTIRYDVGFNNKLYIRGQGAGLSWDKGVLLTNVGPDEWVWETTLPFSDCEFKVLINDKQYEAGDNHHVHAGNAFQYTPNF